VDKQEGSQNSLISTGGTQGAAQGLDRAGPAGSGAFAPGARAQAGVRGGALGWTPLAVSIAGPGCSLLGALDPDGQGRGCARVAAAAARSEAPAAIFLRAAVTSSSLIRCSNWAMP